VYLFLVDLILQRSRWIPTLNRDADSSNKGRREKDHTEHRREERGIAQVRKEGREGDIL
jgi:hypothetical protein